LLEDGMNEHGGVRVVETLIAATNRRDLEGIVGCFTDDVRSETPAHPARSFVGREQVRRNWEQILSAVPDLDARLLATSVTPGPTTHRQTVWAEIAFDGRRADGSPWQMRGVTVNEIVGNEIAALHFYLEPVETSGPGADAAVKALTGAAR
jgi:ketosteroid isomerase-like protein